MKILDCFKKNCLIYDKIDDCNFYKEKGKGEIYITIAYEINLG